MLTEKTGFTTPTGSKGLDRAPGSGSEIDWPDDNLLTQLMGFEAMDKNKGLPLSGRFTVRMGDRRIAMRAERLPSYRGFHYTCESWINLTSAPSSDRDRSRSIQRR